MVLVWFMKSWMVGYFSVLRSNGSNSSSLTVWFLTEGMVCFAPAGSLLYSFFRVIMDGCGAIGAPTNFLSGLKTSIRGSLEIGLRSLYTVGLYGFCSLL